VLSWHTCHCVGSVSIVVVYKQFMRQCYLHICIFCVDLIFQLYQVIKLLEAIEDNKTIRDNSEETMDLVVQMPNKD